MRIFPDAIKVGPKVPGREIRVHFSDDLTGKEYVEAVSDKVLEMKINRPEASRENYTMGSHLGKTDRFYKGRDTLPDKPKVPPFMNFAGLEPCGYRNKKTGEMWPFGHVMIQQHDRYKDNPDLEPVYRYKEGYGEA